MTSPAKKFAKIKDVLPALKGIKADDVEERRKTLTVWVQTASSKELDAVIHFLMTVRIS